MLKKLAFGLVLLVLIGAGIVFYLWRQATALPQWYEAELALDQADAADTDGVGWQAFSGGEEQVEAQPEPVGMLAPEADAARGNSAGPAPAAKPKSSSAKRARKSKRHVLRGFHRRRRKPQAGQKAVKASRAVLDNGKLEAGVVLDLANIPEKDLNPRDRQLYDKIVGAFPGATKRDVYVGIEDYPITKNGILQLGRNPKLRVGNLRYSLRKAAGKLGMTETQLRREFNLELQRMRLTDPDAPRAAK